MEAFFRTRYGRARNRGILRGHFAFRSRVSGLRGIRPLDSRRVRDLESVDGHFMKKRSDLFHGGAYRNRGLPNRAPLRVFSVSCGILGSGPEILF